MVTRNGTPGNNTLTETQVADSLFGFAGNDSLLGLSGNDSLNSGGGNDILDGGIGAESNSAYVRAEECTQKLLDV